MSSNRAVDFILLTNNRFVGFCLFFLLPLLAFSEVNKNGLMPDSEAMQFANKVNSLRYSHTDSALRVAAAGIEATREKARPADLGYLRFSYANILEISGKHDSALHEFEEAMRLFEKAENDFFYHRAIEQIGNVYRSKGDYEKSVEYLTTSLRYFLSVNERYQIHSVYLNLGSAWLDNGKYNLALDAYLKAEDYNHSKEDTVSTALNQMGIGLVYTNLGRLFGAQQHEKAERYFEQALFHFNISESLFAAINHAMGICYARMNKGAVYVLQKKYPELAKVLSQSDVCFSLADKRVYYSFLGLEAAKREDQNDLAQAKTLRLTIDRESKSMHFPYAYFENKLLLGKLYYSLGKHDSAFIYAQNAVDWFGSKGNHVYALTGHKMLSEWYLGQKNYVLAFLHAQKANQSMELVFADITSEIFEEVQLKYQQQMMELELKEAENEKKALRMQLFSTILILVTVLLLFLFLSVYFGFKRRKAMLLNSLAEAKIQKLEKEGLLNEKILSEQKLTNALLEEQTLTKQLELQMKEQELLYQSVKNAELLQIARTIHEKMSPFQLKLAKKKDQDSYSQTLTEITNMANQEILADFDAVFASMHKDFREKILSLAPDLTPGEMQMCALLRMNLSSKEIARLNNISSASVDLMRHKIRQKLNLNQQQNLTSFLIALD